MEELINYAVALMEKENSQKGNPDLMPSQNPIINISQNPDINTTQNPHINSSQNPDIAPSQNPNWKQNQWKLFKETILWEYLDDGQKEKCKVFLKRL